MNSKSCSTSKVALPLLALDIGGKRIGIAISDHLGFSCRGITCLFRKDKHWPQQVSKLVAEYGIKGLVVGLPKNMDGSEGAQAQDCRDAANLLAQNTHLPIFFQDERLSTWTAKERLFAQGLNEKKMRAKLDQTAAAVFLEDFIAANQSLTEKKHA